MRLLRVAIVVTVVGDAENAGEGLAGVGLFGAGDELGRALGDDAAAAFAAFGAEVNDPIGLLDDVEVVLDDEHGVAEIDEALQDVEELKRHRSASRWWARRECRGCGRSGAWKARARA